MASDAAARARLVHQVPGRMRLRLEPATDVAEIGRRLVEALSGLTGVERVEVRITSRSVVVHYDPAAIEPRRILDEGLPAATVSLVEAEVRPVPSPAGGTAVGRTIVNAVGAVNSSIGRASRGFLDLRDAFPLTLFGLGLRRVAQGNLQPVPWYNLLYYGYSTFVALHGRRGAPASAGPDAAEILRRRYALGEITREQLREMWAELQAPGAVEQPAAVPTEQPEAAPAEGARPSQPRRPRRQPSDRQEG